MVSGSQALVIATRGSALALWQAHFVQKLLKDHLGVSSQLSVIKTQGDRIQDRFLHDIGGKGVFVRELEAALLSHRADLAVHSLKDLPIHTPQGLVLGAVLPRHRAGDVVVVHPSWASLASSPPTVIGRSFFASLPAHTRIATGSLRRQALIRSAHSGLTLEPLRGNVDTRLNKLQAEPSQGGWFGIVLAEASLERLGWLDRYPILRLDPEWFTPSPSQGALVIEMRQDHPLKTHIQQALGCPSTTFQVTLERRVLELLGGDCTMPCGIHVDKQGGVQAVVLNLQGKAARGRVSLPDHGTKIEGMDPEPWAQALWAELCRDDLQGVLADLGRLPVNEPGCL